MPYPLRKVPLQPFHASAEERKAAREARGEGEAKEAAPSNLVALPRLAEAAEAQLTAPPLPKFN